MIELAINNLKKIYGGITIFDSVNLELKTNERVGLIGRNGSGKTTIFKMIAGIEEIDSGNIYFGKGNDVGYLHQIPVFEENIVVENVLDMAFEKLYVLEKELKDFEAKLEDSANPHYNRIIEKYGKLQHEFEHQGGYEIQVKKDKICSGFKLSDEFRKRNFNLLSGGEKTVVMLVKILLENPQILLLDEPTNHLDIEAVEWLEEFLSNYEGSVILVSHDRYFLDRVVTKIVELEFGSSESYSGNFSFYQKAKDLKIRQEFADYKSRQKKIKALKAAAVRYREWGRVNTDNAAHMARAKKYEAMVEELEALGRPQTAKKINLNLNNSGRSGNEVVVAKKLSKSFSDKIILKEADFFLGYQEKIALLGRNGSGKTTFLNLLLGEDSDFSGICKLGASTKVGYLEQEITFSHEDLSILDFYRRKFPKYEIDARNDLAKYLFRGNSVFKKVSALSGGEKVRLRLCLLLNTDINFLILDEPTNHLDIDTREILEESLMEFAGTILFISHDRFFINKLATKIAEIENCKIKTYNGNYDYYKELKQKKKLQKRENIKKEKSQKSPKKTETEKRAALNSKKQKEIEARIEIMEKSIKKIEADMLKFGTDYDKLMKLSAEKQQIIDDIDSLYLKWSDLEI